jgi:hypothetical protein
VPVAAADDDARPGGRWTASGQANRLRRGVGAETGELVFRHGGRWTVATGEHVEARRLPDRGVVREITPGVAVRIEAQVG